MKPSAEPHSDPAIQPEAPLPRATYRWPWVALMAVLLAIVLAILWVGNAARKLAAQRDFTPIPSAGSRP